MILSIVMIIIEMHPSLKSVVASVGVCFRNLEKHQKVRRYRKLEPGFGSTCSVLLSLSPSIALCNGSIIAVLLLSHTSSSSLVLAPYPPTVK